MSATRLEKVGTIYSRTKAVLNAGLLNPEYRPLWLKIYERFPPKYEPRFDRKPHDTTPVRDILYKEDIVRAAFFKQFGDKMEVVNLHDPSAQLLSNKFILAFQEEDDGGADFKDVFVRAVDRLAEQEGIDLRTMKRDYATTIRSSGSGLRSEVRRREALPKFEMPSFKDLFADMGDLEIPEKTKKDDGQS